MWMSDKFYESDEFDKFDKLNEPDEKLKIISEFMAADKLSRTLPEYPDIAYTSKFINTHKIAQLYKKRSEQLSVKYEKGDYILKFLLYLIYAKIDLSI
ncbi:6503_t:CDS:2 [Scutellospora calospora]|uniref:6503_t:CDS:1 n=1 Tax=Scutellospora calospora TaxID=85575 RepID=A0ACA9KRR2_9GLOM|nr:6503_t:CDS:2 [Scutellospora calospora]